MSDARADALDIFLSALRSSRVDVAMERRLRFSRGSFAVDGHGYSLDAYGRRVVVALGKAADAMARRFLLLAGDDADRFEGVVVGPVGSGPLRPGFRVYGGGHPSPNADSLRSADDLVGTLQSLTERDLVVFLVSGGGSAMVERLLEPGVGLEDVMATHRALVDSGASIVEINTVRKHISAVKGGRLAAAAAPAEQVTVFVSDVPAGELDSLSSGPTMPDRSTVDDALSVVRRYGLTERVPGVVARMLSAEAMQETPKPGDAIFARSQWFVLQDSVTLEEAAAERARELGWRVVVDNSCDDRSAEQAAEYLVERVRELRGTGERVCLLSAGEVTVQVPAGSSGRGGRNQHFALLCAERIAGDGITVLSGGSDGVDGRSPAAGGVVDGATLERAASVGYPVKAALEEFDGYTLLDRLGDAVMTGPTGNNLRDLRVLLAQG